MNRIQLEEEIRRLEEEIENIEADIEETREDIEYARDSIEDLCRKLEACQEITNHLKNGETLCPIDYICDQCPLNENCFFWYTYDDSESYVTEDGEYALGVHELLLSTWRELIDDMECLEYLRELLIEKEDKLAKLEQMFREVEDDESDG